MTNGPPYLLALVFSDLIDIAIALDPAVNGLGPHLACRGHGLSAALAVAANVFYVVGYTMILKRRTTQNIVWGGAAGCFPALIGWTAVTGELAWAPVVLFLVVFFWTPPHFWALAIRYREDYAAAEVPMLPVVAGARTVARQIVAYSYVMVATSLLLWPVAGTGWFYPSAAVLLAVPTD